MPILFITAHYSCSAVLTVCDYFVLGDSLGLALPPCILHGLSEVHVHKKEMTLLKFYGSVRVALRPALQQYMCSHVYVRMYV